MSDKNILIIDDEAEIVSLLKRILEKKGHHVMSANNITKGKALFGDEDVDILMLDINLPDGNGLDELSGFCQKKPNCNIIMMSAFDSQDLQNKATCDGAKNFISKPFNINSVIAVVQPFTH